MRVTIKSDYLQKCKPHGKSESLKLEKSVETWLQRCVDDTMYTGEDIVPGPAYYQVDYQPKIRTKRQTFKKKNNLCDKFTLSNFLFKLVR